MRAPSRSVRVHPIQILMIHNSHHHHHQYRYRLHLFFIALDSAVCIFLQSAPAALWFFFVTEIAPSILQLCLHAFAQTNREICIQAIAGLPDLTFHNPSIRNPDIGIHTLSTGYADWLPVLTQTHVLKEFSPLHKVWQPSYVSCMRACVCSLICMSACVQQLLTPH
jgi:hypothetical protein